MNELKHTNFTNATVYPCGLDNQDPERGYPREVPVQETPIAKMVGNTAPQRPRDIGQDR